MRERERERVSSSPSFPRRHKILFGVIITVGVLVYAAFNIWVFRYVESRNVSNTPTPSPPLAVAIPTPTPRPIPSGKRTFSVSSDKKTGPQFRNGSIDPYDPKANTSQTITVAIVSSKSVTAGTLNMKTDTKTRKVPLSMVSGTPTNGIWAGTWAVDDTYLYTYIATLTATDNTETNNVELTLR